jgi:ribosomal protein S17E
MKKDGKMLEEKSKEFLTVNFSTNKTLFNLDV